MNTPNTSYTVWAISDLHLSFDNPGKKMDLFGEHWIDHYKKIEENWRKLVQPQDLVLIAGDISWAMKLSGAQKDLQWIHTLPGTKVMIRGNHDYWWASGKKMVEALPSSIHAINNNSFSFRDITIGGARMWDTWEYTFDPYIDFIDRKPVVPQTEKEKADQEKIFVRELERLEMSCKVLDPAAKVRIMMTHYPPIGADLAPSRISNILEKYKIDYCIFGHLHCLKKNFRFEIDCRGIRYVLTSVDYLRFSPHKLFVKSCFNFLDC